MLIHRKIPTEYTVIDIVKNITDFVNHPVQRLKYHIL